MHYDIIIIGSGPGGYKAAVSAARAGKSVAIAEEKHLGGTCLGEGCIPTKCLCRNAESLREIRAAERFGISVSDLRFDISKAILRKNEVIARLTEGIRALLRTPGITLLEGHAHLLPGKSVRVGNDVHTAEHIIIATGSEPKFLPIEGVHLPGVLTSTEILDLEEVPPRLCVIGGGVIGLEFASIFSSFGSEVTVVEYCKEVLPNFDRDIAKRLRTALKKQGISFHTGAAVGAIRTADDGALTVCFEEKGRQGEVVADKVLMAVGRAARLETESLDAAGIAYTRRGITVDEHMQTSQPGIYAVGDVNGLCQLAHAATFQSYIALSHILHQPCSIQPDIVPAAVFTSPEVATVGQTEEQLAAAGTAYTVHKALYRANGKALAMDEEEGIVKLLADEGGRLLGAHILGAHAADLIHEPALLMQHGGTLAELSSTIHAHPALSEVLLDAAGQ